MTSTPDEKPVENSEDLMIQSVRSWLHGFHLHREKPKATDWVNIFLTLFVAAAAFLSAWLFQKQLNQARMDSRHSIESFRNDERAWIEIEDVKLESVIPSTPGFSATSFIYEVHAKNVGKTVARDIVLKRQAMMDANVGAINARAIQRGLDDLKDDAGTPSRVPSLPMPKSLAPNTPIFIPFTIGGTAPQVYGKDPKQVTFYYYLIGRFNYNDAFGIPHWLTFCYVISGSGGNLGYCETGNEEDRNPELPPN